MFSIFIENCEKLTNKYEEVCRFLIYITSVIPISTKSILDIML